jgi:hypothetical protein
MKATELKRSNNQRQQREWRNPRWSQGESLVKAERGCLEANWEIVGSSLHGAEQRLRECFCLKIGIKHLVQEAWIFFMRNMSGVIIGCERHGLRLKTQSCRDGTTGSESAYCCLCTSWRN